MGLIGRLLGDTRDVVPGQYVGNRTPSGRCTYVQPEVGLPEGFVPPSAALGPSRAPPGARGMVVDPAQTPLTLMEPSMQPGQSDAPETPPTAAQLLAGVAGALNACARGGLVLSLRHDTVITEQGYVIRFGTGWEPRMRLERAEVPQDAGSEAGSACR